MPMIAPQRKPETQALSLKLDRRLAAVLRAYAECIKSSQEYIVNEALLATFTTDKDFRGWLEQTRPTDAEALRALLDDRPVNSLPGRNIKRKPAGGSQASTGAPEDAAAVREPER